MKRITITVDESILEQLKAASEESMRPIATEALYRMKLGLSRELAVSVQDKVVGVSAEGFIKDKENDNDFAREATDEDMEKFNEEYEKADEKIEFKTYFKKDGKQK